jgi:hypothetical protein
MVLKVGFIYIDLAVVGYQVASVLFVIGCLYRFIAWLRYPPNRTLWGRSGRALQQRGWRPNLGALIKSVVTRLFLQTFIVRRSWLRWFTHFAIVWGVVVVCAVAFPLAWGWMSFSLVGGQIYSARMFDIPLLTFKVGSLIAFLAFNAINLGSLLLLLGLILAFWQRFRMRAEEKAERLKDQLSSLYVLLAVTVSGLLLAVSYKFFNGIGHRQLVVLHEAIVVLALIWVPFSRLFHFEVSPATVALDMAEGAGFVEPSRCSRCGKTLSAVWTPRDLQGVLASAGVQVVGDVGDPEVLSLCPSCRRHRQAEGFFSKQIGTEAENRRMLSKEV